MVSLLQRLGLDHFTGRLEDEELLDPVLLRSMGPMLASNMAELGMHADDVRRLQHALGGMEIVH